MSKRQLEEESGSSSSAGALVPRTITSEDNSALDIHVGSLRAFRQKGSPVEHVVVPLQCKFGNTVSPVLLETPIFNAPPVYTFLGKTDQDRDRRSLLIENGACPWLEVALRDIVRLTFSRFLTAAHEHKDKLPVICRRLLAADASYDELVRNFFDTKQNGHWFKVHDDCKIYDVDSREEVGPMEGIQCADYKAIIHVKGYYLGQQGASSNACCALSCVIEQLLMRPKKSEVPTTLLMRTDEFFPPSSAPHLEGRIEAALAPPNTPEHGAAKENAGGSKKRKSQKKKDLAPLDLDNVSDFYSQLMDY